MIIMLMTLMTNQAPRNNQTIPPIPTRNEFHGEIMQGKEGVQEGKCAECQDDDNNDDILNG